MCATRALALYSPLINDFDDYGNGTSNVVGGSFLGMSRVLQVVRSGVNEAKKSEVDMYIEEGTFDFQESRFDALEWWKDRTTKFRILSKVIVDLMAIPITILLLPRLHLV
ncbi:hypothetical protein PVK06_030210 [Gossypium arboreum]|uniref:HAT C-terminal dimerisation domain-containing protein n=1 Tax=Gossypium arboreum TaxID=29729 RepID=A0ABR0NMP3_GOSAR|nr:hypothetical protein PVK06_030210 [Gossypium arboreum]